MTTHYALIVSMLLFFINIGLSFNIYNKNLSGTIQQVVRSQTPVCIFKADALANNDPANPVADLCLFVFNGKVYNVPKDKSNMHKGQHICGFDTPSLPCDDKTVPGCLPKSHQNDITYNLGSYFNATTYYKDLCPNATATPIPTNTPVSTNTPVPTVTPIYTPSPTLTPAQTLVPTVPVTVTNTPSVSLFPTSTIPIPTGTGGITHIDLAPRELAVVACDTDHVHVSRQTVFELTIWCRSKNYQIQNTPHDQDNTPDADPITEQEIKKRHKKYLSEEQAASISCRDGKFKVKRAGKSLVLVLCREHKTHAVSDDAVFCNICSTNHPYLCIQVDNKKSYRCASSPESGFTCIRCPFPSTVPASSVAESTLSPPSPTSTPRTVASATTIPITGITRSPVPNTGAILAGGTLVAVMVALFVLGI